VDVFVHSGLMGGVGQDSQEQRAESRKLKEPKAAG
jgi:hypothetical protein